MSLLNTTLPMSLAVEPLAAVGDTIKARIVLYGVGAAITNIILIVINADGTVQTITDFLRPLPTFATFLTAWEANFTVPKTGQYTFIMWDTATGDAFINTCVASQRLANMDAPISTIRKQSTEISRLRNDINRTGYKPPKDG